MTAHLHLMSTSVKSDHSSLKNAIEKSLFNRKAGIKSIFKAKKLQIFTILINYMMKPSRMKIIKLKELKTYRFKNLKDEEWPIITFNHISKGGYYVFFRVIT